MRGHVDFLDTRLSSVPPRQRILIGREVIYVMIFEVETRCAAAASVDEVSDLASEVSRHFSQMRARQD